MTTALADQLKRLAVPQTDLLIEKKTRHSLLFDPREAAKLDKETFYEIGVSGLEELIKLNSKFQEFSFNLFDVTSQSLQRSVQENKANKNLNKLIRRFLLLLSPYFLIKSSHKALEWLVYRYHIYTFNVDDLMALILPYHDTRIFVRVIQMIDLSDDSGHWHWLKPLQGPGVSLSKTALLNRCAADASFLKFICKTTSDALKVYENQGSALSTLLAFHSTTIIGGLEHVKQVNELQITYLLKSLLNGLKSPILDYSAGSYMIVAQLTRRTQLSVRIFDALVCKVAECQHFQLYSECVLLLIILYQTQKFEMKFTPVPLSTIWRLGHGNTWFIKTLQGLQETGVLIMPFFVPLIHATLMAIQAESKGRKKLCKFAKNLAEIAFDENRSQLVIRTVIESFDVDGLSAPETENSEEDGTEIGIDNREKIIKWYANFLGLLERRYAESYDKVIRNALSKEDPTSKIAKATRMILGVMKGGKVPLGGTDLFERIHHPNATIRAEAMEYIVKNYSTMQERDKELVSGVVSTRLKDDSVKVVEKVLQFPTDILVKLVGRESLLDDLIFLTRRCFKKYSRWSEIKLPLVKHLCFEDLQVNSPISEARILLTLLPFIVSEKDNNVMLVTEFQKLFIEKYELLNEILKRLDKTQKSLSDTCSALIHCISSKKEILQDIKVWIEVAEKMSSESEEPIQILFVLLLIAYSVQREIEPSISRKALDLATKLVENYEIRYVEKGWNINNGDILASCIMITEYGNFPLPVFLYLVMQLTKHTPFSDDMRSMEKNWWNFDGKNVALNYNLRVLEILLKGCGDIDHHTRTLYATYLREFFQIHFPDPNGRIKFLCNVSAYPGLDGCGIVAWPELRLRCLRIVAALLKDSEATNWATNFNEPVVPALLTSLSSPITLIRLTALNCIVERYNVMSSSTGGDNTNNYMRLFHAIKKNKVEFELDDGQLPLIMYTTLSPDPAVISMLKFSELPQFKAILDTLLSCIVSTDTPPYVAEVLLDMLISVNSESIIIELLPLGSRVLLFGQSEGKLDSSTSAILCNIIQRLNKDTVSAMKCPAVWEFMKNLIMDWKTIVQKNSGDTNCPAVLIINQISQNLFKAVDESLKKQLLSLLIIAASDSEVPEVASTTRRIIKKIVLDSKHVAVELDKMIKVQVASPLKKDLPKRVAQKVSPSPKLLETDEWRYGVTLLEWIQSKKKLESNELLIKPLFGVLNRCLEFEEQAPAEYTKQLVLSCLLNCCQKICTDATPINATFLEVFNVEAVVQCIRASQNPQTHHHALLLLADVAEIMPEQVLHNIMAIFIFMGSSILRQDDAYSFQVITKIMDTVIPILVKASKGVENDYPEVDTAVCSVLRVFADTVLDVPEHRRLLLYQKLISSLGPERSLWLLLCFILEGHVIHSKEEQTQVGRRDRGELPRRQEFALNLARCFPPSFVIVSCNKMVKYVQTLPVNKVENERGKKTRNVPKSSLTGLFNVELHTAKQLRHYRYAICTFLSSLLSSSSFMNQVAQLSDEQTSELEPLYMELIESMVLNVQAIFHQYNIADEKTSKYWSVMLGLAYDSLDKVNALLPSTMFLLVIKGLLDHRLPTVRRKAMELLNNRLQHQISIFDACEHELFYALIPPLMTVMESINKSTPEPELETNQQVALLSLKLLTRQLASEDPSQFKEILMRMTELVQSKAVQNNLLASVVLCLAELVSSLRAHSISHLNQFMPAVIKILHAQGKLDSPNLVLLSILTAILKILETLSQFVSPYLNKLLLEISIQSAKWQHLTEDTKVTPVINKLKGIRQKISNSIRFSVLTSAVNECYSRLLEKQNYSAVGPLMSILADSFSSLAKSEFTRIMPDITNFFLRALEFRANCDSSVSQEDIKEAEGHVVSALIAVILKLSESAFRPLYFTLHHWATSSDAHKDRIITFYRLSSNIAECLKGLFTLFAGQLIQNAASLLEHTNISKSLEALEENKKFGEEKAQLLLEYILKTLLNVFQYDNGQGFISKERFEMLMQPLVDQLGNMLGGSEAMQSRCTTLLTPCISQFAIATGDDTLWKQMNYQILLKTRHTNPQVRLAALEVLCEMARKLGENFLSQLPETVPFLAELLEDEEETVENACQKAVKDLEEVLGVPLKSYF